MACGQRVSDPAAYPPITNAPLTQSNERFYGNGLVFESKLTHFCWAQGHMLIAWDLVLGGESGQVERAPRLGFLRQK